jgi:hypothetical protein
VQKQKPSLPIPAQAQSLRTAYPLSQFARVTETDLRWLCNLRPTPISDNYFIQLDYVLGGIPRVQVIAPALVVPPGKRLPHVFPDGCICIYDCRENADEWSPCMELAIIVPWAALWLFYYEAWLTTGVWHGKEARH